MSPQHRNHDFKYAMQFGKLVAQVTASWPSQRNNVCISLCKKLFNLFCLLLLTIHVFGQILYIFAPDAIVEMRLQNIAFSNFTIMCEVKYVIMLCRGRQLLICIEQIDHDFTSPDKTDRLIMLKYARIGRLLCITVTLMFLATWFLFNAKSWIQKPVVVDNVTVHVLAYAYDFLVFDPTVAPYYVYARLFELMSSFILVALICNSMCIITGCTLHACGQYAIVIRYLNNLLDGVDDEIIVKRRIAKVVRKHNQTIRFIGFVETACCEMCLIEMICGVVGLCVCEYFLIMEKNGIIAILSDIVMVLSVGSTILVFCFFGEILIDQANKIGSVIYTNKWYLLSGNHIRSLTFMFYMCQRPPKLTAGKISILCIDTYSEVLKKSLAYLNVFRAVMVS